MKTKKAKYKVSVYLIDEKTSYRLRFYYKEAGKFLQQFEQRFEASNYDAALQKRDAEQAKEKWVNYKEDETKTKNDFISYYNTIAQSKKNGTKAIYLNSIDLFKRYRGNEPLPFNKVNKDLVNGFREFLLGVVKQNTANARFACFAHVLNKAEDENLIERIKVLRIPQQLVKKDVLTEEEINTIIKTEWVNRYKEIFLFECLTSVSFDDMKRLKWKQIEKKTINIKGEKKIVYKLSFIRGKTGNEVNMILSDEIINMLGEGQGEDEYIFMGLTCQSVYNNNIKGLIKKAGINKHITSHCGRATAIIRVTESEGIYAAAKQAGHSKIDTTLRYAQYTDNMMYKAQDALMSGIKFNTAV